MNRRKLIKWLVLLLWMGVIFLFSAQANSGEMTHGIIKQIFPTIQENFLIDIINFMIRKSAHFTEYFILTFLFSFLLKEYTKKERVIFITSIFFCFLYACSDEIHQAFVPGRSSLFKDVLIDTSGGIFFIITTFFYQKWLHPTRKQAIRKHIKNHKIRLNREHDKKNYYNYK